MIPAIVLAAGASSRMGTPKALLDDGAGRPFVVRVVETLAAAGVDEILIVVGFHAAAVRDVIEGRRLAVRLIDNPAPQRGQLSSLQAGLAAVDRPGVVATLVTLVDVPLVQPRTVQAVVDAYRRHHALIVRPSMGSRHGHPVLFDRAVFSALRQADPEQGAKPVIQTHAAQVLNVPVTDEGAFQDFDTKEDYKRLFSDE